MRKTAKEVQQEYFFKEESKEDEYTPQEVLQKRPAQIWIRLSTINKIQQLIDEERIHVQPELNPNCYLAKNSTQDFYDLRDQFERICKKLNMDPLNDNPQITQEQEENKIDPVDENSSQIPKEEEDINLTDDEDLSNETSSSENSVEDNMDRTLDYLELYGDHSQFFLLDDNPRNKKTILHYMRKFKKPIIDQEKPIINHENTEMKQNATEPIEGEFEDMLVIEWGDFKKLYNAYKETELSPILEKDPHKLVLLATCNRQMQIIISTVEALQRNNPEK